MKTILAIIGSKFKLLKKREVMLYIFELAVGAGLIVGMYYIIRLLILI